MTEVLDDDELLRSALEFFMHGDAFLRVSYDEGEPAGVKTVCLHEGCSPAWEGA
jgi:hypothetical protein